MSAVLEPSEVSLTKYISAAPIKLDDSKLAALIDKRSEVQVVRNRPVSYTLMTLIGTKLAFPGIAVRYDQAPGLCTSYQKVSA